MSPAPSSRTWWARSTACWTAPGCGTTSRSWWNAAPGAGWSAGSSAQTSLVFPAGLLEALDEPARLLRAVGQDGDRLGGVAGGVADGLARLADGGGHGVRHGLHELVTARLPVPGNQELVA